jgi:hypothetical protein
LLENGSRPTWLQKAQQLAEDMEADGIGLEKIARRLGRRPETIAEWFRQRRKQRWRTMLIARVPGKNGSCGNGNGNAGRLNADAS